MEKAKSDNVFKQFTEAQLGWIAGIIDGEGCISTKKNRRDPQNKRQGHISIAIAVGNTDQMMILRLAALLGGWPKQSRILKSGKTFWRWEIAGRRAWTLLEKLLPHLVTKYPRALVAIELGRRISTRRGYRTCGGGYKGLQGAGISVEELKIRDRLYDDLKRMNSGISSTVE